MVVTETQEFNQHSPNINTKYIVLRKNRLVYFCFLLIAFHICLHVSRGCTNSVDSFCYICGEFIIKKYQRDITENIKKLFKLYFGCRLGDEDKKWAPPIICMKCVYRCFKVQYQGSVSTQWKYISINSNCSFSDT